jgi:Uma2 family endonuclease
MIATAKTRYTPADLLTMPDGKRYELVDGQLVELNMSMWSSHVAGIIHWLLTTYCRDKRLGWTFPEGTSYQCFAAFPNMVGKPDCSFIRLNRLTIQQAQAEGHGSVVPDLVVEVISPNDIAHEVDQKVHLYLTAGVALVWVVNPEQRTVAVHRAATTGTILRENDEVSGEEVVPGFRCRVGDFFVAPAGAVS